MSVEGLDDVAARPVAVWGMGREGLGVVALLRSRGARPLLVDDDLAAASARVETAVRDGGTVVAPDAVDWSTVGVVVRAPGVSRYRPELRAAASAGAEVTTAMALWLHDFADARVIAVTGTKGKSTTATLAAGILRAMGRRVDLVGNIGVPVTETYEQPRAEAYVVEVSSYQAADVRTTPRVAVVTGLAPDHLDWHGDVETYYRDKLHLLSAGPGGPVGRVAVDATSDEAVRRTSDHPHRLLYGRAGRVTVDDDVVRVDGAPFVETANWAVPGLHNRVNLCGAMSGVLLLEGSVPPAEAVSQTVSSFDGLPSRCHVLGERDGVVFVDDALASNPSATVASLDVFAGRPLTLLCGGADRGVDVAELAARLARAEPAPSLVVIGSGGRRVAEAVRAASASTVAVREATTLEDGVAMARAGTPDGGVVLFSPSQPTPPEDGDYRDRSRRFAAAAGFGERPGEARPAPAVGQG